MALDGPLDTAMVLDIIVDTIHNNEDRVHVCNRLPLVCKHTLSTVLDHRRRYAAEMQAEMDSFCMKEIILKFQHKTEGFQLRYRPYEDLKKNEPIMSVSHNLWAAYYEHPDNTKQPFAYYEFLSNCLFTPHYNERLLFRSIEMLFDVLDQSYQRMKSDDDYRVSYYESFNPVCFFYGSQKKAMKMLRDYIQNGKHTMLMATYLMRLAFFFPNLLGESYYDFWFDLKPIFPECTAISFLIELGHKHYNYIEFRCQILDLLADCVMYKIGEQAEEDKTKIRLCLEDVHHYLFSGELVWVFELCGKRCPSYISSKALGVVMNITFCSSVDKNEIKSILFGYAAAVRGHAPRKSWSILANETLLFLRACYQAPGYSKPNSSDSYCAS